MRTGVATVTLVSSTDQNTPLSTSTVAVAAAGSVVYRQQMALPPTQKPNPVTAVTERTFKLASKLQAHGELFNWSVADVQCIVSPRLNTRIIAGTLQSYYQKFLFSNCLQENCQHCFRPRYYQQFTQVTTSKPQQTFED